MLELINKFDEAASYKSMEQAVSFYPLAMGFLKKQVSWRELESYNMRIETVRFVGDIWKRLDDIGASANSFSEKAKVLVPKAKTEGWAVSS